MNIIFWICAVSELLLTLWWLQTDMKLTHKQMNPYIPLALLYLGLAFIIRFSAGWIRVSDAMVVIPAIPLLGLGLIIGITMKHGGRWN